MFSFFKSLACNAPLPLPDKENYIAGCESNTSQFWFIFVSTVHLGVLALSIAAVKYAQYRPEAVQEFREGIRRCCRL